MENKDYNINELLNLTPLDLANWLHARYLFVLPTSVETVEDLRQANELLSKLTNTFAYIESVRTFASIYVREGKKKKLDKEIIDDRISRRDVLDTFANMLKAQYNAMSRMITVKKQIDEEMNMYNSKL